jgi:hypothetical protein
VDDSVWVAFATLHSLTGVNPDILLALAPVDQRAGRERHAAPGHQDDGPGRPAGDAAQIALDDSGQRRPVAHHDVAVVERMDQRGLVGSVARRVVARLGQRRMKGERIEQQAVVLLTARLVVGQPVGERAIHASRVDSNRCARPPAPAAQS